MRSSKTRRWLASVLFVFVVGSGVPAADDKPKAAEPGSYIVVDATGKELKLKTCRFVAGTRRLSWLAPPNKEEKAPPKDDKGTPKDKVKAVPRGPEALEFRDDQSTTFAVGIVTLVPVDRIRALVYDHEKQSVTLSVAAGMKLEDDVKLVGTTKYAGENKLTLEAEVDKGEMGVAEVRFLGGTKKGIRALRFPAPRAGAQVPAGRAATIVASDKDKSVHKVVNVQALYRLADGSLRLEPTVMFRKTLKVGLDKVKRFRAAGGNVREGFQFEVLQVSGEEPTLTVLRIASLGDKPAALEGLLGQVAVGYKLFPVNTIGELRFEDGKEEKKP